MIYGVRLLKFLLANEFRVNLVVSKSALLVWQAEELGTIPSNVSKQEEFWRSYLAEAGGQLTCHHWADVSAVIASGSFRT